MVKQLIKKNSILAINCENPVKMRQYSNIQILVAECRED